MQQRYGNFTSSEIFKLMTTGKGELGFGAAGITYIKERKKQRRLKKSFTNQGSTATRWGQHFEPICFNKYAKATGKHLISYSNPHTDFRHSHIKNHGGTPDFVSFDGKEVGSIKCPFTENAFVDMYDIIKTGSPEHFKKEDPEKYWQLISDAIVSKAEICTFVIYMPYLDEVESELMESELYWMSNPPHLLKEGEFNDLAYFSFPPPPGDIELLESRINAASTLLEDAPTPSLVSPIPEGAMAEGI